MYGNKDIIVRSSLYDELKTFITYARLILTDDKFRSAKLRITSSANDEKSKELMNQINHSLVSKCLTRSFEKAEVFEEDSYKSVPQSKIRFSVITQLIMLGEDTLDNIVHCFVKHSTETCKKFYMQFYSNREATCLSWKSLRMFTNIAKEEEKAIEIRQTKLSRSVIPSLENIKLWHQDIRNILKLSEDLDLSNKGLETLIEQFKNELRVNEDLDSNDEDGDEHKVVEEDEEVLEEEEELAEEPTKPHNEPQTISSATITNFTNIVAEPEPEDVAELEEPLGVAPLPKLGSIYPFLALDEEEEE